MTGGLVGVMLLVVLGAAARGTWSPCGLSMVSAINPLSERSRGNRYWLTTLWFIAGATVGGTGLGLGGAALAFLLRPLADQRAAVLIVASIASLVTLAADLRVAGFHLPLHPRQVNELWLMRYRRWLYAAGFGVQIGVGFATYIMTAATYLVIVLVGLTGSPAVALLAGVLFGLVRGLAVLLSCRCRTGSALQRLHARLSRLEPASMRMMLLIELAAAITFGAAAGSTAAIFVGVVAAGLLVPGLATRLRRVRVVESIT
ncbi:MAG: hypothetical protein ACJ74U_04015 [Jatrophihabitantaceae bacterium]